MEREEVIFKSGVWATIQCLAAEHNMSDYAVFVAMDMRITPQEAKELQSQSGCYDEIMNEVIKDMSKGSNYGI